MKQLMKEPGLVKQGTMMSKNGGLAAGGGNVPMPSVFLRLTTQKGDNMGAVHGFNRGATKSFNRGATSSGGARFKSPVENIIEDTEYSPEPSEMVQRQPSFSAVGSRYPKLRD